MARCKYCKQKMEVVDMESGRYSFCKTPGCRGGSIHHHSHTFDKSGGHQSWNHDRKGNVWDNHFVDDGHDKGEPKRFPFGRKDRSRR
jgi:hypothetical protein